MTPAYPSNPLLLPHDAQRIVCVSNCIGRLPAHCVRAGDVVVHLNTARHALELLGVAGTWHALICRHRKGEKFHPGYFTPGDFEGFSIVHFTPTVNGWSGSPWWQDYARRNPGQCPTTGYLAWQLAMEAAAPRGLPVLLLGYQPQRDAGTYRAPCHAWLYEAKQYARNQARIIDLLT